MRMSSSRLPGKSLLPVVGFPLFVLSALRLRCACSETLVLTSQNVEDDAVQLTAETYGLRLFRGDLHDVMKRYIDGFSELNDDEIVVRATGDNVVPDSNLACMLVDELVKTKAKYIRCDGDVSGGPIGLSLEAFYIGELRALRNERLDSCDYEHVTRRLRDGSDAKIMRIDNMPGRYAKAGVDNAEDYKRVSNIFSDLNAGVETPAFELCRKFRVGLGDGRG